MLIRLLEIPEEGQSFSFTRHSSELNSVLSDIIKELDYDIEVFIQPVSQMYEVRSRIKTSLPLVCSNCAFDINLKMDQKFSELLFVKEEENRTAKELRVNHISDLHGDGPFCNIIYDHNFDIGEYLHELIAHFEPIKPLGCDTSKENCPNFQTAKEQGWFKNLIDSNEQLKENPFSILKKLKLPSLKS